MANTPIKQSIEDFSEGTILWEGTTYHFRQSTGDSSWVFSYVDFFREITKIEKKILGFVYKIEYLPIVEFSIMGNWKDEDYSADYWRREIKKHFDCKINKTKRKKELENNKLI